MHLVINRLIIGAELQSIKPPAKPIIDGVKIAKMLLIALIVGVHFFPVAMHHFSQLHKTTTLVAALGSKLLVWPPVQQKPK